MNRFRASSMSYCVRQIVHDKLHGSQIPEEKRPFLDMGHKAQEAVEDFLHEHLALKDGIFYPEYRESEAVLVFPEIRVVGHVDGLLETKRGFALLEVKAIMDSSYKRLKKAGDMMEVYGQYNGQAQTYMATGYLQPEGDDTPTIDGPFEETIYVFVNRNTSEMMGGIPIDHPAWTYREDMILKRDPSWPDRLLERLQIANKHIESATLPEECDAPMYCYFCKQKGKGGRDTTRVGRVVTLECGEDMDAIAMESLLDTLVDLRGALNYAAEAFTGHKAREITTTGLDSGDDYTLTKVTLQEMKKAVDKWLKS